MPLVIEKIEELEEKVKGDEILESLAMKMTRLLEEEKILGLYDAEKQEKMVKDAQIEYATKLGKEEVAKNLLKKGISMDIIISSTGLNQKEILKLK